VSGDCPRVLAVVAGPLAAPGDARADLDTLPADLVVERLCGERGFPSETITALHRDRGGFLWVGSREGLALFDGYTVRVFDHAVADPGSLSDNAVRTVYEDRQGAAPVKVDEQRRTDREEVQQGFPQKGLQPHERFIVAAKTTGAGVPIRSRVESAPSAQARWPAERRCARLTPLNRGGDLRKRCAGQAARSPGAAGRTRNDR